jgi:two-component system, LytTR family, sensor histidine kinase AlgZ
MLKSRMYKAQSINQNLFPNCRSLGVILRAVLWANAMALVLALAQANTWREILHHLLQSAALLEPILLSALLLLAGVQPWLARLPYWRAAVITVILTISIALVLHHLGAALYIDAQEDAYFQAWRCALLTGGGTSALLGYFSLRSLALSPSLHHARLQALQARIRPHFLFNSINAVLGIVRSHPKRAEMALEDMSDLFRSAMADNRDLVTLDQEIALTKQYLALEKLRLEDRLQVYWQVDDGLETAHIPALILQPLLENAVYHGIEPLAQGGLITVQLSRQGNVLHLNVRNPRSAQPPRHSGNKMALANIRERLALQFDVEAKYRVETGADFYCVHLHLPYLTATSSSTPSPAYI